MILRLNFEIKLTKLHCWYKMSITILNLLVLIICSLQSLVCTRFNFETNKISVKLLLLLCLLTTHTKCVYFLVKNIIVMTFNFFNWKSIRKCTSVISEQNHTSMAFTQNINIVCTMAHLRMVVNISVIVFNLNEIQIVIMNWKERMWCIPNKRVVYTKHIHFLFLYFNKKDLEILFLKLILIVCTILCHMHVLHI